MRELAICLREPTFRRQWRWWVPFRWVVFLLAVVFADAQRGRCYASAPSLVSHSPAWHEDVDVLPDENGMLMSPREGSRGSWLPSNSRPRRERRSQWQNSDVWFVNLVERGNVSMELKGQYVDLKYASLGFGEMRMHEASVTVQDRVYVVEYINGDVAENRSRTVESIYQHIPDHSVWFIVASSHYESTAMGYEDMSLTVAPIIRSVSDVFSNLSVRSKSCLFVYSTFLASMIHENVGVDIWGLKREENSTGGEKFRIVRMLENLRRYHSGSFLPVPGVYEVKVVRNRVIKKRPFQTLTDFKNTDSLIPGPPQYIELKAMQQTTLVIGGQINSYAHRKMVILPPYEGAAFNYPKTKFMIFNAFPCPPSQLVEVGLIFNPEKLDFDNWAKLQYRQVGVVDLEMRRNDHYTIGINEGGKEVCKFQSGPLKRPVPFYGHCAMIANQKNNGSLSPEFLCIEDDGNPLGSGSWMMIFHGLVNYTGAIDVFFKWAGPSDPNEHDLVHVSGIRANSFTVANVRSGLHLVKVAPGEKIKLKKDFDLVSSLVEEACVNLTGTYPELVSLGVVHGTMNGAPGSLTAPVFSLSNSNGEVSNVDISHCRQPLPCPSCANTDTPTDSEGTSRPTAASHSAASHTCRPQLYVFLATAAAVIVLMAGR